MNEFQPKCDICGRYMKQEPGSSWKFVPETLLPGSYEEDATRCKTCTEKHGIPEPFQDVKKEMCCGIIK